MEKRHERESRLKEAKDEDARKAQEEEFRKMQERHKKHERPHHPMTKDQLEEVSERLPEGRVSSIPEAQHNLEKQRCMCQVTQYFVLSCWLLPDLGRQR